MKLRKDVAKVMPEIEDAELARRFYAYQAANAVLEGVSESVNQNLGAYWGRKKTRVSQLGHADRPPLRYRKSNGHR